MYLSLAGINFGIELSEDPRWVDFRQDFHGFMREGEPERRDVSVRFRIEEEVPEVVEGDFAWHCKSTSENVPDTPYDYEWKVCIDERNREVLYVNYFSRHPFLKRVRVDFNPDTFEAEVSLQLLPNPEQQDIMIMPLFMLFLSRVLWRFDAVLIHASCVSYKDRGRLFTAVSGTGKSTMARIWERCGATIINDDMLIMRLHRPTKKTWVFNIPMPYYKDVQRSVLLDTIFFIRQSKNNEVAPLSGAVYVMQLMSHTAHQTFQPEYLKKYIKLMMDISSSVGFADCGFLPDERIVDEIQKAGL